MVLSRPVRTPSVPPQAGVFAPVLCSRDYPETSHDVRQSWQLPTTRAEVRTSDPFPASDGVAYSRGSRPPRGGVDRNCASVRLSHPGLSCPPRGGVDRNYVKFKNLAGRDDVAALPGRG